MRVALWGNGGDEILPQTRQRLRDEFLGELFQNMSDAVGSPGIVVGFPAVHLGLFGDLIQV